MAGDWGEVEGILTDISFVEAKSHAGMTYDLIADYEMVLKGMTAGKTEDNERVARDEAMAEYISDLLAFTQGKLNRVNVIPSIQPLGPRRVRLEIEEICSQPTSVQKISAFQQFVTSAGDLLARHSWIPGFCYQEAYNFAGTGPVARAIDTGAKQKREEVVFLRHSRFLTGIQSLSGATYCCTRAQHRCSEHFARRKESSDRGV